MSTEAVSFDCSKVASNNAWSSTTEVTLLENVPGSATNPSVETFPPTSPMGESLLGSIYIFFGIVSIFWLVLFCIQQTQWFIRRVNTEIGNIRSCLRSTWSLVCATRSCCLVRSEIVQCPRLGWMVLSTNSSLFDLCTIGTMTGSL